MKRGRDVTQNKDSDSRTEGKRELVDGRSSSVLRKHAKVHRELRREKRGKRLVWLPAQTIICLGGTVGSTNCAVSEVSWLGTRTWMQERDAFR